MDYKRTRLNIFAADIGYAQCKFQYSDSATYDEVMALIPSAVAEPMTSMQGLGSGQKIFVLDHGKYVFGRDALEPGSKQIQSLNEDWLLKFLPGFICAGALAAGVDLHEVECLSTGLPIQMWRKYKESLPGELKTIRSNGETYKFDRVDLLPQGVGALGYHGKLGAPSDECGLLLDIGGNTVLAVRYDDMKPKATNTRQYDRLGILSVAHDISPMLSQLAGGRVSEIEAMQAIKNRKFLGSDISTQVDSAIKSYCEILMNSIREDYHTMIPRLDKLIVCGGGSYLVGEALKAEYPRTVVLPEPEFANVRGYHWLSLNQ